MFLSTKYRFSSQNFKYIFVLFNQVLFKYYIPAHTHTHTHTYIHTYKYYIHIYIRITTWHIKQSSNKIHSNYVGKKYIYEYMFLRDIDMYTLVRTESNRLSIIIILLYFVTRFCDIFIQLRILKHCKTFSLFFIHYSKGVWWK